MECAHASAASLHFTRRQAACIPTPAPPSQLQPRPTLAPPQIGAALQLREFASGVKVVQSASHSDEAILARIREMAQPKPEAAAAAAAAAGAADVASGEAGAAAGGAGTAAAAPAAAAAGGAGAEEALPALLASLGPPITRLEVAMALGVSVAIAGEHLSMAEGRGALCRDEGPRGLVFYRNFFPDFADASPTA